MLEWSLLLLLLLPGCGAYTDADLIAQIEVLITDANTTLVSAGSVAGNYSVTPSSLATCRDHESWLLFEAEAKGYLQQWTCDTIRANGSLCDTDFVLNRGRYGYRVADACCSCAGSTGIEGGSWLTYEPGGDQCVDYPLWRDEFNRTCSAYGRPDGFVYVEGELHSFCSYYRDQEYENVTASDACCACFQYRDHSIEPQFVWWFKPGGPTAEEAVLGLAPLLIISALIVALTALAYYRDRADAKLEEWIDGTKKRFSSRFVEMERLIPIRAFRGSRARSKTPEL